MTGQTRKRAAMFDAAATGSSIVIKPASGVFLRQLAGFLAMTLAMIVTAVIVKDTSLDGVSPWWPPAGIGFAYLVIVGPRGFVAVLIARYAALWFAFDWPGSVLPRQTVVRSFAIVAVYTLAAVLYRQLADGRNERGRLLLFLGIGVLAGPALAGTAAELVRVGFGASGGFVESVRTFWIGDAVAIATISPFLLVVANRARTGQLAWSNTARNLSRGVLLETAAMVLPPALVLLIGNSNRVDPSLSLAILPILWITLRHRPVAALGGLLVLNSTSAYVVSANLSSIDELSNLQTVMLASAVAALIIAAEVRQREIDIDQLISSEARYRRLVDGSPDLVVGFDDNGPELASASTKFSHQDEVVEAIYSLQSGSQGSHLFGPTSEHEWTLDTSTGPRWYRTRFVEEPDQWPPILSITTDLTDVRMAERELEHARNHDNLTGLPNRNELIGVLGAAEAQLGQQQGQLAVIHIGLDRFGAINQAHGQATGDEILRLVATRLSAQVPAQCCLARMGGDEFAIGGFLPGDSAAGEALAQAIVELGRQPLIHDALTVTTTLSTGLATTAESGSDPAELLRSAEVAVSAAKEAGRDRYVVSDPQRLRDAVTRSEILADLRKAIDTDELILHYQPEVDLVTGIAVGYEALLRWNHPRRGLLLASEFIAVAEESRIIDDMTYQLIDMAAAQLAQFATVGGQDLFMGINLSPTQLDDENLVDYVVASCEHHQIRLGQLRIEVTETTLMHEYGHAVDVLRRLRALGASVAIDDFGTGYASIGYLHKLPVNVIKIDRSFVTDIVTNETDKALVRLIASLTEGLGLTITAEGIETSAQRDALIELNCVRGQGFGLGRPESGPQALEDYARRSRQRTTMIDAGS